MSRTMATLRAQWAAPGAAAVPGALAVAVVGLQIAYPLVPTGPARDRLTVAIVVVFAAASVTHALAARGPRFTAALLTATTLGGMLIEVVGVATGVPFGPYRYLGTLGPQVAGVPLVVALAWTMMAYPAYVVGQTIGGSVARRVLVGGWALAAWDLFLDPQMVQAGHWEWIGGHSLTHAGIPLSNYAAWLAVATLMMAALQLARVRGSRRTGRPADDGAADDRVPLGLYAWTWASSTLAHAAFFDLPASAVTGGVGMGVVVAVLVVAVRSDDDRRRVPSSGRARGRP